LPNINSQYPFGCLASGSTPATRPFLLARAQVFLQPLPPQDFFGSSDSAESAFNSSPNVFATHAATSFSASISVIPAAPPNDRRVISRRSSSDEMLNAQEIPPAIIMAKLTVLSVARLSASTATRGSPRLGGLADVWPRVQFGWKNLSCDAMRCRMIARRVRKTEQYKKPAPPRKRLSCRSERWENTGGYSSRGCGAGLGVGWTVIGCVAAGNVAVAPGAAGDVDAVPCGPAAGLTSLSSPNTMDLSHLEKNMVGGCRGEGTTS